MMIDACLGIMGKEKLPNLGKYKLVYFFSSKTRVKFSKFPHLIFLKCWKTLCVSTPKVGFISMVTPKDFIHRLKLVTVKLKQLHLSLRPWKGY